MQKGHGRPALIQADGVGSGGRPADPASGPSKPSQRRACTTFLVPRLLREGFPTRASPKRLAKPVQSGRCLPLTSIPEMKPRTLHEPTRALVGKGARVLPSRNKSQELPEPTRTIRGPPPRALSPGPARSKPIASQSRFSEGTFSPCVVKDSTVPPTSVFGANVAKPHNAPLPCANPTTPHHTQTRTTHCTTHHTPRKRKFHCFLAMVRADASAPLER